MILLLWYSRLFRFRFLSRFFLGPKPTSSARQGTQHARAARRSSTGLDASRRRGSVRVCVCVHGRDRRRGRRRRLLASAPLLPLLPLFEALALPLHGGLELLVLLVADLELAQPLLVALLGALLGLELDELLALLAVGAVVRAAGDHGHHREGLGADARAEHALHARVVAAAHGAPRIEEGEAGEAGACLMVSGGRDTGQRRDVSNWARVGT